MTLKKVLLTALLVLVPQSALAYLNPEEVLLNRDLYLPPTARDAMGRSMQQADEAAARREREQEAAFALQHPSAPEEEIMPEEDSTAAAPQGWPAGFFAVPVQMGNGGMWMGQPTFGSAPGTQGLDSANLELLRTMRLLSRVNQNQVMEYPQSVHGAANPLAPSGAGAVITALTMAGSVLWTMRRASKAKTVVSA
ncbi:hypothetical protein FJZ28_00975 [Candidatus Peregrinibacteria bacterium]|nr:hypothetical protein [Candidatus Peregrinibacteria bacterium]